jgi:hypothetical protein
MDRAYQGSMQSGSDVFTCINPVMSPGLVGLKCVIYGSVFPGGEKLTSITNYISPTQVQLADAATNSGSCIMFVNLPG